MDTKMSQHGGRHPRGRADDRPRVFARSVWECLILRRNLESAAERAVEQPTLNYSPASAMLEAVRIETAATLLECADLLPTNAIPLGIHPGHTRTASR